MLVALNQEAGVNIKFASDSAFRIVGPSLDVLAVNYNVQSYRKRRDDNKNQRYS